MRRTVVIIPDLLAKTPEDSPLLQKLETLRTMTELGELQRVRPLPNLETPEAVYLGLNPNEGQMKQGPLTVAAFGQDPPDRSIHFHVSLLGVLDGFAMEPPAVVAQEELAKVLEHAKRLNTKTLTFLNGENTDHALVWEGLGDLHTTPAKDVIDKPIKPALPEGDAERELRRFIDDSINLLSELEFNERRIDEGLPPLNLLWPWGHGRRQAVPNLLLKRGERAHVESNSMRLAGLTRLAGYRHGDRGSFGAGINTRLALLATTARENELTIIVIDAPQSLKENGLLEELHWFVRELDERLLKPLFDNALKERSRIALLATAESEGLALNFETAMHNADPYPFDERSLEERSLKRTEAWDFIARSLKPEGIQSAAG